MFTLLAFILGAPLFMAAAIIWSVYGFIKLIRISIDYEDFCELYFGEPAAHKPIKRFIIKHKVGVVISITIFTLLFFGLIIWLIANPDIEMGLCDLKMFFTKLLGKFYKLIRIIKTGGQ